MKRILSLALSAAMVLSSVPMAYATEDWKQGTKVEYVAQNNENWTITVPAKLQPGASGTVTLEGYWPSNKTITVGADDTVVLKNSILQSDTKTLNITFLGITKSGNNVEKSTATETVSVQAIENALFGTWNGSFYYNVETNENTIGGCDTLYWDGNTEGLISIQLPEFDRNNFIFTKVSDVVPTADELRNGVTVTGWCEGETYEYPFEDEMMQYYIPALENNTIAGCVDGGFVIVPYDNYDSDDGIIFPEKGIYLFRNDRPTVGNIYSHTTSVTINGYTGFEHSEGCLHNIQQSSGYKYLDQVKQGDYIYTYLNCDSLEEWQFGYLKYMLSMEEEIEFSTDEEALEIVSQAMHNCSWADLQANGYTQDMLFEELDFTEETYYLMQEQQPFQEGWHVGVVAMDKTEYAEIATYIDDIPVVSMYATFADCANLETSPAVPNTVTSMYGTFSRCSSLTEAPLIPDSVVDMRGTFAFCTSLNTYVNSTASDGDLSGYKLPDNLVNMEATFVECTSLVKAPNIPVNVTNMRRAFEGCTALVEASAVPSKVTDLLATYKECTALIEAPNMANAHSVTCMDDTFYNCTSLTTAPIIPSTVTSMMNTFIDCESLQTYHGNQDGNGDFSNYVIPNNVTNMADTFLGCVLLETAPVIPISVTDMYQTFYGCTSLTGTVTIHANPTKFFLTFYETPNPILLTGTSEILYPLACTDYDGTTTSETDVFTFTIDGKKYQTRATISWRDWINSEYNTDGFVIVQAQNTNTSEIKELVFDANKEYYVRFNNDPASIWASISWTSITSGGYNLSNQNWVTIE